MFVIFTANSVFLSHLLTSTFPIFFIYGQPSVLRYHFSSRFTSSPPEPLCPNFTTPLFYLAAPFQLLSHSLWFLFFFFFFKYPSSPLVLFIALHFLYRHSSACCITPEIQPPLLLFLPSRLPFSLTSFDVWRRVGIHSADKERGDDVTADMIHQHLLWSKNTHHRAHTVSLQLHSAFVSTSTLYWDGPAFTQLGLVGTLGYMPLVHNWAASVYLDIKV